MPLVFNGKTFGNGHGHRDQRTIHYVVFSKKKKPVIKIIKYTLPSWVHNDEDRQQEEYDRIEQESP
jgi:hypothetical protein